MAFDAENVPARRVAESRFVVTGAAGFIGSTVVDHLVALGADVIGVDDFDPWYDPARKRANLAAATQNSRFALVEADAADVIGDVLEAGDVIIHLAGRPGVQDSWGLGFTDYARRNIELTQRVFEEALGVGASRVVCASSSSICGASSDGGSGRRLRSALWRLQARRGATGRCLRRTASISSAFGTSPSMARGSPRHGDASHVRGDDAERHRVRSAR